MRADQRDPVEASAQVVSRESVLLVDDEPQVLVALEDLLSDKFVVFKADNGQAALQVIEQQPDIAVVVTDQRMPRMCGDEFLSRLGENSTAQRILVTGFADLNAVVRAVNEGKIFAYVTKPWEQEDLRLKVQRAAEQFRMGRELAYERQLLHDLMDNSHDGIYFKDNERRFIRVNRAFAERFEETTPDQLVGKRLDEVGVPQAMVEAETLDEREVLELGEPVLDMVREFKNNGTAQCFSESKVPIRGTDGDILGLVGISRDVTRQRALEQQLTQVQKMEAIGQLAGGVAHDLNNLLAVIGGYGEMVLQAMAEDDVRRQDIGEMLAATRRAEDLIKQLLTFSRRQVVQPRELSLNDAVSTMERMLRRVIVGNIEIRMNLASALGTVRADPTQVDQVIVNLAVNARDAMPNGGQLMLETANVVVSEEEAHADSTLRAGSYVVLVVSDTGVGMDVQTQRHIFEPFFTTKEVGKGTGLGLSNVYGIMQQNGGYVTVHSEVGKGTCFRAYFPRVGGEMVESIRPEASAADKATAATILLVEDNPSVRQLTARLLRSRGYSVHQAGSLEQARAIVDELGSQLQLLLTDVVMPGTSGPKLAAELKARIPGLKVLYMSGYPGSALAKDGALGPDVAYLEKPFSAASLEEKVRSVLQNGK